MVDGLDMNKNEIVQDFLKAGQEINRIKEETEQEQKEIRQKCSEEQAIIRDQKWELEKKERDLSYQKEIKIKESQEAHKIKVQHHAAQREGVKRIIAFLEIQERNEPLEPIPDPLERVIIHDDEYLKVYITILQNRKPVNKYDVRILGDCLFGYNELFKPDFSFGYRYGTILKSHPTVDAATKYIEKIKGTIAQDVIKRVDELKKEYLEVIETYKLSDFEELFEYTCYECRNIFKENISEHQRQVYGDRTGLEFETCTGQLHRQIRREV